MVNIDEVRKSLTKSVYKTLKQKGYDVKNVNGVRFPFKADGNEVVANVQEYDKFVESLFNEIVYPQMIIFGSDKSFSIIGTDDEGYDYEYNPRDFSTDGLLDFNNEVLNLPNREDAEYSSRGLSKGDEIDWHGNTAEILEISEWGDTWTLKLADGGIVIADDAEIVEQNPDLGSDEN